MKIKMLLVLALIASGCSREFELQQSVFIQDPEYPNLPVYSEWGYNTFGVYFDRTPVVSSASLVPAKFIASDGGGIFVLQGQFKESFSTGIRVDIKFILRNLNAQKFDDLVTLNAESYVLTGEDVEVLVAIGGEEFASPVLEGELIFKRAQFLRVDGKPMEVILSGTFDFKAIINGKPQTFQHGRFDVGIMKDNFFKM